MKRKRNSTNENVGRANAISSPTTYKHNLNSSNKKLEYGCRNNILVTSPQWHSGSYSIHSSRMRNLTISVPNVMPSRAQTGVNDEVKRSALLIKENTQQYVRHSGRKVKEKKRGKGYAMMDYMAAKPEGRWIKHYSSCHRILLVGEGDFSFSTCLAVAFGWASNMVATSLDSQDFLVGNYRRALSNIVELSIRKCRVMHEIDATEMANHGVLGRIKFDRIIFNFPFAGFFKNLSRDFQLRRHKRLVSLFLKNAKEMIRENGEIHITHKTNGFYIEWKLESLASSHKLMLIEAVDFNHLDYTGYNAKCGFGGDSNFYCYPSKTYKFGLTS